jgi:Cof subfamily protein (haloacid dehalogenase superfamily)
MTIDRLDCSPDSILFVSDLDGTLLNSDARLSDFTRETINRLIEQGLKFSLATARSISSAKPIIEGLRLTLPAVMMNGVFLTDIATGRAESVCRITPALAQRAIDAFYAENRPPNVFYFDGEHLDVLYTGFFGEYDAEFAEARRKKYHRFEQVDRLPTDNAVYLNAVDRYETVAAVKERLDKIDGLSGVMYRDSYSPYWFLECFAADATKEKGVARLASLCGAAAVVAFGDNDNDVGMMNAADVAVAVGNASAAAKNAADHIISSNNTDSVAEFLMKYCIENNAQKL